jgi:hypothetical protein
VLNKLGLAVVPEVKYNNNGSLGLVAPSGANTGDSSTDRA